MSLEQVKAGFLLVDMFTEKTRKYVCNSLVKENRIQMKNVIISTRHSKADSSEQPGKKES